MDMAITYKKAGVDISEIKKSQRAIGKLIESTHGLQKMAKMKHGFGHYAGTRVLNPALTLSVGSIG